MSSYLSLEIEREAPPGSFSQYDIAVMLSEFEHLTSDNVYVEIGVQYGRSLYVAAKYSDADVYGFDIEPTLRHDLLDGLEYTYDYCGSDEAASMFTRKIDLLFIDGDHSYGGVVKDVENWLPHMKQGGTILFHDCDDSSPETVRAVKDLFPGYETFKDTVGNTSIARVKLP